MVIAMTAADKKKRRKAYATIIRGLLASIEAAKEIENNILVESMSEQWRYANQQYNSLIVPQK